MSEVTVADLAVHLFVEVDLLYPAGHVKSETDAVLGLHLFVVRSFVYPAGHVISDIVTARALQTLFGISAS